MAALRVRQTITVNQRLPPGPLSAAGVGKSAAEKTIVEVLASLD